MHSEYFIGVFIYYQAYPEMIKGSMLSDAILTMSSMNVIAGELDA
jgi:NADH-quinone oxidoreductase subunit D